MDQIDIFQEKSEKGDFHMKIISVYTRKDAINDGELIDVSVMAKEAGFKFPVAVTRKIWFDFIQPDDLTQGNGESSEGRLWDVLFMLHIAITKGVNRCVGSTRQITLYKVLMTFNGKIEPDTVILKAICHPGDECEPVITIMGMYED